MRKDIFYENVETASPNRSIHLVAATQILERQDTVITRTSTAAVLETAKGLMVCDQRKRQMPSSFRNSSPSFEQLTMSGALRSSTVLRRGSGE